MKRTRFLPFLAVLLLATGCPACGTYTPAPKPVPVDPVDPVNPVPPDPVVPAPPVPAGVATAEAVAKVVAGMTVEAMAAALGVGPSFSSVNTEVGTIEWQYAYVAADGTPLWLNVTSKAGVVLGRSSTRRAVPK